MEERRGVYRVLVGKLDGKRPLGRPRSRWGIILRLICKNWDGVGLDWSDSGQGQVAVTCECGYEPSGYIKCGEFLD
jgi:hypothetical protein